ncbi:bifunctional ADP-dependent NAD(P)H-hydrate dehydratase/NAD(P)H-hydrate epimerase [Phaeobacter inhibens]|uniref:bifunctional ADP-dependent NAD(P)H-hydrate dehydratase/NAD(P)H-hydrate epimerase n=1 Tax=Phaeobacter inhibens TaxID=221822 RepID=UPI00076BBBBF|nr:bifunctional ADP-dependent NAD(P)H-hydrate dehydratase/NAD(P)H-hydrate epimerase [Phaeobacter inhibens]KXF92226.1 bifunctional ADP-dependent (S)-NAD(P)H-hydrate dehydratase/NAD(P)H-hydrate epimerase [Phaeobacter inhibens]WHP66922.1 bifunctional ADP-dependent NAD(P)H-hydrate dehydratase/NAD(P)H-hydrate epimerase [Phaeobacter inhibens]
MTELLTAAQMQAIEQAAIASGEVTGLELMERAGQGVVEAIFEEWPEYITAPQSVAVLCGPGNNGGDGFVVARLLAGKGWTVKVFLYGDPEKLPPDARTSYEIWVADNQVEELTERAFRAEPYCLYVDALFGAGLSRPLTGEAFDVISHMSGRNGDDFSDCIVAIDAPSALCLNSGTVLECEPIDLGHPVFGQQGQKPRGPKPLQHRFAALTVTFDSPKFGHFINEGPSVCGRVAVKDIGLEKWRALKAAKPGTPPKSLRLPCSVLLANHSLVEDRRKQWISRFDSDRCEKGNIRGHKYSHGHALILSGGHGRTGAARLAARGAFRIGAGLVTVGSPRSAMMENACQLTAIMLRQIDGPNELDQLLEDRRINAVCLGPGLGLGAETQMLVMSVLEQERGTVLDADALTQFEQNPGVLFEALHGNCVITPHGGEFARLFPDIAEKLNAPATTGPAYSKVDATREAAKRAGCVVLFKGPDTVIAAPNGCCSVNSAHYDRSAPWLATAGSGDVLAGFITGLMARGLSPMQAAETAAYLHVECALNFGPGLIAEDLPEQIPTVLRRLDIP